MTIVWVIMIFLNLYVKIPYFFLALVKSSPILEYVNSSSISIIHSFIHSFREKQISNESLNKCPNKSFSVKHLLKINWQHFSIINGSTLSLSFLSSPFISIYHDNSSACLHRKKFHFHNQCTIENFS